MSVGEDSEEFAALLVEVACRSLTKTIKEQEKHKERANTEDPQHAKEKLPLDPQDDSSEDFGARIGRRWRRRRIRKRKRKKTKYSRRKHQPSPQAMEESPTEARSGDENTSDGGANDSDEISETGEPGSKKGEEKETNTSEVELPPEKGIEIGGRKILDKIDEDSMPHEELREQCEKWGLGRGVDITKQTPWMEKTSFQVRAVRTEHLLETDEGGLLKGYSDLVDSSTSIHSQVQAGVKAPNVPLAIGVDSEYSRTDCSSKHVVGLKVKNRTISFQVDFEDVPNSWIEDVNKAKETIREMDKEQRQLEKAITFSRDKNSNDTDQNSEDCPNHVNLFETRLCMWLNDCLRHRGIAANADNLYQLLDTTIKKGHPDKKLIDDDEQTRRLEEDIRNFVEHIGVTHYISAIELGGLRFSILTEQEYEKKVAASGSASLNSMLYGGVEAQIKNSFIRRSKSRRTERKQIGKITRTGEGEDAREVVERKDEAVIGCQIRPISNLVRNPYIRLAVEKGVKEYTEAKINFGGPYLVSCGDDQPMYLTASPKTREITITFDKTKADAFNVKTVNETRNHHELEFSLTSSLSQSKKKGEGVNQSQNDTTVPLEYTMEVARNAITGRGSKAPQMRLSTNHRRTRMLLKKRSDRRISCDTKDWIKGTEAYYIQCIHPLANTFLCIKEKNSFRKQHGKGIKIDLEKSEGQKNKRFKVCVTRCGSAQRNEAHYYMLFRLHPQRPTKKKPEQSHNEPGEKQQLDNPFRTMETNERETEMEKSQQKFVVVTMEEQPAMIDQD